MNEPEQFKQEWHDWVGELFEPHFGITVESLLNKDTHVNEESAIQSKVHYVAPFDADAIRNVYRKVHMMTVLDEEMKTQKWRRAKGEHHSQKQTDEDAQRSGGSTLQKSKKDIDLNDSCIWNSEEISVLRQVFKAVKKQNVELSVHVRELDTRNKELEEKVSSQEMVIQKQKGELLDVKKANARLKIHCDFLQSELDLALAKCGAFEEVLKDLKLEKAEMMQEVYDNHVAMDKQRLEREVIQMKLDNLKQVALAEKLTAVESVKTKCQQKIFDLQQEVKKLTEELNKERYDHKNTQRGLKHLRQHFASLSVQDILPPNAVTKDQIGHLAY
ncbi:hypothetical protein CHS0354_015185 [Potamilus streckersoni]|uniref:Uncharacterized protein n=1 Tax=Potamilus streckersoni TaxID=2493646 RepID=A0AAE0VTL8_9BIVA|nr:hypothetical protein CHS0354_015185 [Potamilus streckersoni]